MSNRELEFKSTYTASKCPYNFVNGEKIYKVIGPFYEERKGCINGKCPACNGLVNRVWNLNNCGNCGCKISWHDISVQNYHDVF